LEDAEWESHDFNIKTLDPSCGYTMQRLNSSDSKENQCRNAIDARNLDQALSSCYDWWMQMLTLHRANRTSSGNCNSEQAMVIAQKNAVARGIYKSVLDWERRMLDDQQAVIDWYEVSLKALGRCSVHATFDLALAGAAAITKGHATLQFLGKITQPVKRYNDHTESINNVANAGLPSIKMVKEWINEHSGFAIDENDEHPCAAASMDLACQLATRAYSGVQSFINAKKQLKDFEKLLDKHWSRRYFNEVYHVDEILASSPPGIKQIQSICSDYAQLTQGIADIGNSAGQCLEYPPMSRAFKSLKGLAKFCAKAEKDVTAKIMMYYGGKKLIEDDRLPLKWEETYDVRLKELAR
jgi:hypothetical protein